MAETDSESEIEARLAWAVEIAVRAGAETLRWFCQPRLDVERKGDGTPVTAADRAAETLLRDAIGEKFPDDGILGEEFGEKTGSSDYRWLLDPIDGTKAFITGVPLYTTLIGIMAGSQPRAGVIHAPAARETVYAGPAGPCWYRRDDQDAFATRVSTTTSLDEATFVTSSVKSYEKERSPGEYDAYQRLESAVRLTRTWGDAFGYLLVATGRADIVVDPAMDLWDSAALQPIIEAAGGTFTDWQGVGTVHSGDSVATNGHLHKEVLATLRGRGRSVRPERT